MGRTKRPRPYICRAESDHNDEEYSALVYYFACKNKNYTLFSVLSLSESL